MTPHARRTAVAAIPFGLAAALFGGSFALFSPRLPDRIATHFGGAGGADGYQDRWAFLAAGLAILVGLGAALTIMCATGSVRRSPAQRWLAAGSAATSGLLAVGLIAVLLVNRDAATPEDVRLPLWFLAVMAAAAALLGLIGWWAAGPDAPADGVADGAGGTRALRLMPGESAAWSRQVGSVSLLVTAGVCAVVAVVLFALGPWGSGLTLLLAAVVCGAFGSLRVTVDGRGLTVGSALVPRPRMTVPLERITAATRRDIRPLADFGGWGYRIRPGASGLVLRSGDALSLRLRNGREFVVTVDDAATAAALIGGLIDRRRKATPGTGGTDA
ncbi:DUF1648 domain-containing protein [Streptomyces sp. RFCAC02]|uniref:DUF1648 domain-containing protein n=1 Tax=Streptomyces sp. RFCAC02 TaxID=2499143 RepID=UPI00101FCF21|nr:DUF1648 domain-containing protein [Streptomyces sp. RFCAC02]